MNRYQQMLNWLHDSFSEGSVFSITPISGDASFRRYFRMICKSYSYIIMDAPPDKESCGSFVAIAKALEEIGLQVPSVLVMDLDQGFLLLTDLGQQQYLPLLQQSDDPMINQLYQDALRALLRLQTGGPLPTSLLPGYDSTLLHEEMELFREWFLGRYLQLSLKSNEHRLLDEVFKGLSQSALDQPQVWVHRDYHSRNLMFTSQFNPGILDFQDAVVGPVTYDLVSLLKDCYIAWPRQRVQSWVSNYQMHLHQQGMAELENPSVFLRWFDLMGLQRHFKAIGIFTRLFIRDNKSGYLADIPRTLTYILETANLYPELTELKHFLYQKNLMARMEAREQPKNNLGA